VWCAQWRYFWLPLGCRAQMRTAQARVCGLNRRDQHEHHSDCCRAA
jgi:hypothetical protein